MLNSDGSTSLSTYLLQLADKLRCLVCKEKYRTPRTLRCNHVFCTGCLADQVETCHTGKMAADAQGAPDTIMKVIRCTVCKQFSLLPPKGVKALPIDKDLAKLALSVFYEKHSDDGLLLCTCCNKCEKAEFQCRGCVGYICTTCANAHKVIRCLEFHKVIITLLFYITAITLHIIPCIS